MKIAYMIGSALAGSANGIVSQAVSWADGLRYLGNKVDFINPWEDYDWQSYDVIHLFGYGTWLDMVQNLKKRTKAKIVLSTIMDSNRPALVNRLASHVGGTRLNLTSPLYALKMCEHNIAAYLVRSEYEKDLIAKTLAIKSDNIHKVPLISRFTNEIINSNRDKICLHVSLLSSKNKNVARLIKSAIKYKYKLVLAGKIGDNDFEEYLNSITQKHSDIEYIGFLSDDELKYQYSRAKVFALPSLFEGVGLVALEAAAMGANIVLTKRGGPKEYYNGLAYLVEPLDIDDIGKAVTLALEDDKVQPGLSSYISSKYNTNAICNQLIDIYNNIL